MENKGSDRKRKKTRDNLEGKQRESRGKQGETLENWGKQEITWENKKKNVGKEGGNIGKQNRGKQKEKLKNKGKHGKTGKQHPLSPPAIWPRSSVMLSRERDQHSKTRRTGKLLASYRLGKIRNC